MVITVVGMIMASLHAAGIFDLTITIPGDFGNLIQLGLEEMNGFGMAVVFSAWGGDVHIPYSIHFGSEDAVGFSSRKLSLPMEGPRLFQESRGR